MCRYGCQSGLPPASVPTLSATTTREPSEEIPSSPTLSGHRASVGAGRDHFGVRARPGQIALVEGRLPCRRAAAANAEVEPKTRRFPSAEMGSVDRGPLPRRRGGTASRPCPGRARRSAGAPACPRTRRRSRACRSRARRRRRSSGRPRRPAGSTRTGRSRMGCRIRSPRNASASRRLRRVPRRRGRSRGWSGFRCRGCRRL